MHIKNMKKCIYRDLDCVLGVMVKLTDLRVFIVKNEIDLLFICF